MEPTPKQIFYSLVNTLKACRTDEERHEVIVKYRNWVIEQFKDMPTEIHTLDLSGLNMDQVLEDEINYLLTN